VNPMAQSTDVPITQDRDVERCLQSKAVETVQSGSRRTTRPDVATDVEHQGSQFGARVGGSAGEAERVRADLEEGTARDSAPKLCVGDSNAVRLLP
jgi:hypothetical protein